MDFNNLKLSAAIAGSGITQNELADKLNVHRNTISAWATGNAVPTPFKLYRLLRIVGYDDEQLKAQRLVDWYSLNGN